MQAFTLDPSEMNPERTQEFVTAVIAFAALLLSAYSLYKQRTHKHLAIFLHLNQLDALEHQYTAIVANEGTVSMFVRTLRILHRVGHRGWLEKTIHEVGSGEACFLKPGEARAIAFTHPARMWQPAGLIATLHNGQEVNLKADELLPTRELQSRVVLRLLGERIVGRDFRDSVDGIVVDAYSGSGAMMIREGNKVRIYGGGIWCEIPLDIGLEPSLPRHCSSRWWDTRLPSWWKKTRFYVLRPESRLVFRIGNSEMDRAADVLSHNIPELFGFRKAPWLLYGEEQFGPYCYWKRNLWRELPQKLIDFCIAHGVLSEPEKQNGKAALQ